LVDYPASSFTPPGDRIRPESPRTLDRNRWLLWPGIRSGTQQPSGIRGVLLARPGINCLLVVALRGQVKPTSTGYVGGRRQWVALRGWAAVLCLGPWGAMRAAPMPSLPPGARRRVPANDRGRLCDHQGVTPPRPATTASFCGLRATATRVSLVSGARRPAIPRWQAGGPWLIR